MFYYALLDDQGAIISRETSDTPLTVGEGAPGDYAMMREMTTAEIAALSLPSSLDAVDQIRDARLAAGYVDATLGKTFQCDEASQTKITAIGTSAGFAIVMATAPVPTFEFIAADNTTVTMTPAQAFAWSMRIMGWVSATILYGRSLKDALIAGQSPDTSAGWPS